MFQGGRVTGRSSVPVGGIKRLQSTRVRHDAESTSPGQEQNSTRVRKSIPSQTSQVLIVLASKRLVRLKSDMSKIPIIPACACRQSNSC